jgi:ATP-dependent Clp protease ATP-binding subunit ClpC
MFERYDESARRVVFFARYEASQFGSPEIDTEHLLLGVLREDRKLVESRSRPDAQSSIRARIEREAPRRRKTSTSIDLPFSRAARDALEFAAQEAGAAGERRIAPRHILLGLSRVESSLAAKVLTESGADLDALRPADTGAGR